jgi:hypothetical protein
VINARNPERTTMTDQTTEAAPAAAAPEKAPKDQKNGVTRPAGDKTGRVWAIADEISKLHKRPATRKEVLEAGAAEGLSAGTLGTQYGAWTKYHGITREVTAAKPAPAAEQPNATAPAQPAASTIPDGEPTSGPLLQPGGTVPADEIETPSADDAAGAE